MWKEYDDMSSRKEVQNHNIFEDSQDDKQPKHDQKLEEDYALKEKMTIPRFYNEVAKDSGWSQKTDTR